MKMVMAFLILSLGFSFIPAASNFVSAKPVLVSYILTQLNLHNLNPF